MWILRWGAVGHEAGDISGGKIPLTLVSLEMELEFVLRAVGSH